MAVFRDDMLQVRRVPAHEYYEDAEEESSENGGDQVDVVEFRAAGPAVADRLDIMGVNATTVLAHMDKQFSEHSGVLYDAEFFATLSDDLQTEINYERAFRASLDAREWVDRLASVQNDSSTTSDRSPGSLQWLMAEIAYWDERFALRVVLLAFPDAEVVLDVTDLEHGGWLDIAERPSLASAAAQALGEAAGMHAPVVVLTEGRTDAEFLAAALTVLYPHLTDLIRFLDYDRKPEGGVAALVRMVRAFAAAGIVNRVVAIFDNDTAAADGLRSVDLAKLPVQIQIMRYPALDLAKEYPTIGPPTLEFRTGSVSLSDVNGLAGSIELYLGKDVLMGTDGTLRPVQWKSYIAGMARYQGEVTGKEIIHERFRAKYSAAIQNPDCVRHQDWEGLHLVLDAIRAAAESALGGRSEPNGFLHGG